MVAPVLKALGWLYAAAGLYSLAGLLGALVFFGNPALARRGVVGSAAFLAVVGAMALSLLNAVALPLMAYSFLTLRRWGRQLAIAWTSVLVAVSIAGFLYAWVTDPGSLSSSSVLFRLLPLGVLGGTTVLCLHPDAKKLMVN